MLLYILSLKLTLFQLFGVWVRLALPLSVFYNSKSESDWHSRWAYISIPSVSTSLTYFNILSSSHPPSPLNNLVRVPFRPKPTVENCFMLSYYRRLSVTVGLGLMLQPNVFWVLMGYGMLALLSRVQGVSNETWFSEDESWPLLMHDGEKLCFAEKLGM